MNATNRAEDALLTEIDAAKIFEAVHANTAGVAAPRSWAAFSAGRPRSPISPARYCCLDRCQHCFEGQDRVQRRIWARSMKRTTPRSGSVDSIDTLLAIKAIGLADGLGANDRRVAVSLIEHFRRRDGRCDPGLNRIAGLLGISVRTVIRCVHRLVAAGLVRKARHGGLGNRNSYHPNWERFGELEEAWRKKFREKRSSSPTSLSPGDGQVCI